MKYTPLLIPLISTDWVSSLPKEKERITCPKSRYHLSGKAFLYCVPKNNIVAGRVGADAQRNETFCIADACRRKGGIFVIEVE